MPRRPLLARLATAATATCLALLAACSAEAPAADDPGAELDVPGESNSEEALTEPRNIRGADKMNAKEIALTFDDGPRTESIAFAQWLKDQGVVATFFMTGESVVSNATTRTAPAKIAAMGHLVANHTYTHPIKPSFASLSSSQMIEEIAKTDKLIASSIPAGVPSLLRTSGGSWSSTVSATLNGDPSTKHYLGNIYWDIGGAMDEGFGADWACWGSAYKLTPAACGARYLKEIAARGNKGIVLLHDIHANTRTMVRDVLVPELKRQGFTFVRVDKIAGITPEAPGTPTTTGAATAGATCADGCIWSAACVNKPHAPNAPGNVPLVCVQRGNCSVRCTPR
jgi:peptidoglycan-N-acetylglucosamine deacetylase